MRLEQSEHRHVAMTLWTIFVRSEELGRGCVQEEVHDTRVSRSHVDPGVILHATPQPLILVRQPQTFRGRCRGRTTWLQGPSA